MQKEMLNGIEPFLRLEIFLLRLDFCKDARGSVRDGRSQSRTVFLKIRNYGS